MKARGTWMFGAGVLVGLALWASLPLATAFDAPEIHGASGDACAGSTVVVGDPGTTTNSETIYIWDHGRQRLAVYHIQGNALELLFVRNCEFDFQVDEFALKGHTMSPPVKEIKEALKK